MRLYFTQTLNFVIAVCLCTIHARAVFKLSVHSDHVFCVQSKSEQAPFKFRCVFRFVCFVLCVFDVCCVYYVLCRTVSGVNGISYIIEDGAKALAGLLCAYVCSVCVCCVACCLCYCLFSCCLSALLLCCVFCCVVVCLFSHRCVCLYSIPTHA